MTLCLMVTPGFSFLVFSNFLVMDRPSTLVAGSNTFQDLQGHRLGGLSALEEDREQEQRTTPAGMRESRFISPSPFRGRFPSQSLGHGGLCAPTRSEVWDELVGSAASIMAEA